jgi:hypothetical protein
MMRVRLDVEMLEQFARDGFLTFETRLTASQVTLIRDTLVRLHRRNAGFRQGALFDAMGPDAGGAMKLSPQMMHPHAFAPELLETDFFFLARGIAEQLLGAEARFRSDVSLMKPAYFGEATPWHQDEAFQDPAFAYRQVSFWLALQPTTESNSCMSCIPGSHLGTVLPHWFPGGDVRIHALDCADAVDLRQAVSCTLPAGGCLILDQRTVHGAGPNVSACDSLGYVLTFELAPTPVGAPRSFPWLAAQQTARSRREMEWRRRPKASHILRQATWLWRVGLRSLLSAALIQPGRPSTGTAAQVWPAGRRGRSGIRQR